MRNKFLRGLMELVPILAGVFGAMSAFSHLIADVKAIDFVIAATSVAAAACAGIFSVKITRIAKELSQTRRIFISYSWDQKEKARELRGFLQAQGAKVWLDENALQPGSDLQSAIGAAIESSNTVVALVSGKAGPHLSAELRTAKARNVPVYALWMDEDANVEIPLNGLDFHVMKKDADLAQVAKAVLAGHQAVPN